MILLLQLLQRIAGGERLERSSRLDTAWWLSVLVAMPLGGAILMACFAWVGRSEHAHVLDTMAGMVTMVVLMVIVLAVLQASCVRIFRRRPLWLVPIVVAMWGGGVWWFLGWL